MAKFCLSIAALGMFVLGIVVGDQHIKLKALEREREAYEWRKYTCQSILNDPITRRIMCAQQNKAKGDRYEQSK
jgi:hypothetical protein